MKPLPLSSPLSTRLAIFGAAVLFSVPFAGPADAQLLPPGAPAGAISLATVRSKQVGKTTCAYLKGRWEPGQVSRKIIFLSRKQQIANVRKTAKGKRAKTQIARLQKQLKAETKTCNKRAPLRLSLKDVAGVSVTSEPVGSAKPAARSAQAQGTAATSNLAAILPNGAIRDAILSGAISVGDVSTAPSGDLYLAFGKPTGIYGTPVDLTDATTSLVPAGDSVSTGKRTCTIAKVDINTGVPTCVDDYGKNNHCGWLRLRSDERIQIDVLKSGDVYYLGKQCNIPLPVPVLTRSRGGVEAFMSPENSATPAQGNVSPTASTFQIARYAPAEDGSVFISGSTGSYSSGPDNTLKESFYRLTPEGAREEVAPLPASFIERFPDGNIYYGLIAGAGPQGAFNGVRRYLSGVGTDPVPWFGSSMGETAHQPSLCYPWSLRGENPGFCGSYGAEVHSGFAKTTTGRVFAAPGGRWMEGFSATTPPALYQYYPTLERPSTAVQKVGIVVGAGSKVVLTGLDSSGTNLTTVFDPESGVERTIVEAAENIRMDSLNYSKRMDKLIFTGTRLADGASVVGTVGVDSGAPDIRPYAVGKLGFALAALG